MRELQIHQMRMYKAARAYAFSRTERITEITQRYEGENEKARDMRNSISFTFSHKSESGTPYTVKELYAENFACGENSTR